MSSPDQDRIEALTESVVRLIQRVEELEQRLVRLERGRAQPEPSPVPRPSVAPPRPVVPPPLPQTPPPIAATAPPPVIPVARPIAEPVEEPQLETQMGLTWVNRIGVVTLIIGVAFFFKYAIDNQWIGETGRVVLGVIAGLATVAAGDILWRRGHIIFGQGICGLGVSILYLSFYASFGFYHLLPQAAAFVLMAMVTAMSGALALRYGAVAIAGLGLLGGFSTPILLSTGHDAPWTLFSYILLLDLGALLVARQRSWRVLEAMASLGTLILYAAWFGEWFGPEKRVVATAAALAFYTLFQFVGWPAISLAFQVLAGVALAAIWSAAAPYLGLSLALAIAGLAIADRTGRRFAASVSFATFWGAYGQWQSSNGKPEESLLQFWALTAAFAMYVGWTLFRILIRRSETTAEDLSIFGLNGPIYFTASYALLNPGFHAWMGLLAAAVAAVYLLCGLRLWKNRAPESDNRPVLLALGLALSFLTLAIPIQFTEFRITLAWAIEAAALTWIGRRMNEPRLLFGAIVVFAFVFLRLFAFDTWIAEPHPLLVNSRFVTFAISAVAFWLGAWFLKTERMWAAAVYICGHLIMLYVILVEFSDWARTAVSADDRASLTAMGVSILMALYAVMLVTIGVLNRSVLDRILGLGLFGLVILKLYLFDVWEASRLFRTVAFVALGLLLLLTSYLYSRFRSTIESWWRDEQAAR